MKYNQIISIEQEREYMKQNKCNKQAHGFRMLQFNELAFNDEMTLNISKFEGIIRGQWYREDGKLQSICYGTAIAISKRVILTCAHSIYLQKRRRVCDSVKFIPNHKQGRLNNSKVYKSAEKQYIRFQELRPDQTFTKGAIPEDIALIYLSEDLDLEDFPMVGLNNEEQVRIGGDLLIAGYPSADYYSQPRLEQIYFKRHTLKGKLLQIQNHNIYHDLFTQTGHSGSGIVGFSTITRKPTVLGVHTHKGKKRNTGVYLSNFLLKRLAKYQIQFGLFHSQYKIDIKFPQAFKINAFSELCETQKKMLSTRSDFYSCLYNKDMQVELGQQNSQMLDIFKGMSTPQQQQLEMSIIYQQSIQQKLQKMMEENRNMALQIFQQNQLLDLMYELVKVQNTFFRTIKKLNHQNKQATVLTKPIKNDLFQLCIRVDKQLSQARYELQKMDQFQIIVPKFANIQEHLYHNPSTNQILLQQNDYQYHRFEEQYIQISQQFVKNREKSITYRIYEFQRL